MTRRSRSLPGGSGLALLLLAGLAALPSAAAAAPPKLDARAWILIDGRTGERLAGRRESAEVPVASATKLMTARLALARLPLSRRVPAPRYDARPVESKIGLREGERMTVRDLLYALILESANDAAVTLATAVAGSVRAFVAEMNREAARLGLRDTSFRNPIGLDEPGHRSSARDLAVLTRRLLASRTFGRIADTGRVVLRSGSRPRRIVTRNDLLLRHQPLTGVKTGRTGGAGYVLVGSERRADLELISVVLGADSENERDTESLRLLGYGFSLYERREPIARGRAVFRSDVRYEDEPLPLRAARSVGFTVRQGARVRRVLDAPPQVEGPIRRGERLGTVRYLAGDLVLARAPLVAGRAVEDPGLVDRVEAALPVPLPVALMLSGVIVMLSLVASQARSRARRRRRREAIRARRAR